MICKWVDDSQHLILENFDIICDCPSEIYHYTLPFSPSSSWFHEHYGPELSKEVKVVKGCQVKWGICSHTASLDRSPSVLTSWKGLVAVGSSGSGDIITLDAITGICTSVLSGHSDSITSLDFSSDGMLLVSGSYDKTVKLWEIQTGGVIKTFHGHTYSVDSVSISPGDTMIASGSSDSTICLWDTHTRECHCIIELGNWVTSVNFPLKTPNS